MAGTDVDAPPFWEQQFPADPAAVAGIRRGLADYARSHGATDAQVAELTLAVSEAATNAVVHAYVGIAPGTVRVRATPGDDSFHLLVADDGTGMMPRGDSPGLGLGLPTIAQLTTSFDIRAGAAGRGTEVHMVFELEGLRAPAPAPDADAWRFELLGEVTRLTGTGWPSEGVGRLLDLLVPTLADACTIDLVEADGPRRVAARIVPDDDGELTAWLCGRRPPDDALASILPALRHGEVHVVRLDPDVNRALATGPEDERHMSEVDLAWWVNVPLTESGVLLGMLGLGLAPSRPHPEAELSFLGALGDRAARGLASTHLVEELRRTRRRLERILSALSEAVTVQDSGGRTVYANTAAATLLGAASVDEVLSAPPGELADRFDITREDGSPVTHSDLPGDRVLTGDAETATLLTRSVTKETGVERWLLTKATLLEDGEPFAVNIIEDITDTKNAELHRRLLAEIGELVAGPDAPGSLPDVAHLAVPAIADWCAIDVGTERVAEAGDAGAQPRDELAVALGKHGTLHLATRAGARALTGEHRAFAEQLAARIAAGLDG